MCATEQRLYTFRYTSYSRSSDILNENTLPKRRCYSHYCNRQDRLAKRMNLVKLPSRNLTLRLRHGICICINNHFLDNIEYQPVISWFTISFSYNTTTPNTFTRSRSQSVHVLIFAINSVYVMMFILIQQKLPYQYLTFCLHFGKCWHHLWLIIMTFMLIFFTKRIFCLLINKYYDLTSRRSP